MNYQLLIADDEEYTRTELEYIIEKQEAFHICASCSNGTEALEKIVSTGPDIVLLDIHMPGLDGIKLGGMLENIRKPPYIIYVTAFQEYAVEALNMGARGYILKPFSEMDVCNALERAADFMKNCVAASSSAGNAQSLKLPSPKVAAYDEDKILFFNQSDILLVEAKNRKVYLNIDGVEYLSRYSLVELESKLDRSLFFRAHRNFLINLNYVENIVPWFNNTYIIHLKGRKNSYEIPLSRDNVKRFKTLMGI